MEALEVGLDGPFALIEGRQKAIGKDWDPGGNRPRFFNDPPEFFTIATGHSDGLHWGYWFDDPATLPPVVASYHHNDSCEIGVDGDTIFEALRAHLEYLFRDAEDYAKDDPDNADDHGEQREALGHAREALSRFALGDRAETGSSYIERHVKSARSARKASAPTRSKIGVVVPKKLYRPLEHDGFLSDSYKPGAADVALLVHAAKEAITEGYPGAALKLGHDLWGHAAFAEQSYDMLDRAYGSLGRKILRDYLKRVTQFRKRCARAQARR